MSQLMSSMGTKQMKRIEELQKWISVLDNEINKADLVTMENNSNGVSETIWIDMSKLVFYINFFQNRKAGPYLESEIVVQETLGIFEELYLLNHVTGVVDTKIEDTFQQTFFEGRSYNCTMHSEMCRWVRHETMRTEHGIIPGHLMRDQMVCTNVFMYSDKYLVRELLDREIDIKIKSSADYRDYRLSLDENRSDTEKI